MLLANSVIWWIFGSFYGSSSMEKKTKYYLLLLLHRYIQYNVTRWVCLQKKSTHASLEILLPSVVSVTFFIFFFSRVKNGQFVFKVDIYVDWAIFWLSISINYVWQSHQLSRIISGFYLYYQDVFHLFITFVQRMTWFLEMLG